jgi:hypothetical protein
MPREVLFTYDAKWEHSDIKWASRCDLYLYMGVCTQYDLAPALVEFSSIEECVQFPCCEEHSDICWAGVTYLYK